LVPKVHRGGMPAISRFFGIVIYMYHNDHPDPHFHAHYGEYRIIVDIRTGLITGNFPATPARFVREWMDEHRSELLENWRLARIDKPLNRISPLE
jgi:hypothetical protein